MKRFQAWARKVGRQRLVLGAGLLGVLTMPYTIITYTDYKSRRMNRPLEQDLRRLKQKGRSLEDVPRSQ